MNHLEVKEINENAWVPGTEKRASSFMERPGEVEGRECWPVPLYRLPSVEWNWAGDPPGACPEAIDLLLQYNYNFHVLKQV